jgi:putative transposase
MRKENPTRYSSAVGDVWLHAMFKVKYCHKVFDHKEVREEIDSLFDEASKKYDILIEGKGFDADHVHMKIDIGNYSRPQVAKMLKGYVAKKLLKKFSWLKHKYFWKSGLWNRSYFIGSAPNLEGLDKYLKKQKWFDPSQKKLSAY